MSFLIAFSLVYTGSLYAASDKAVSKNNRVIARKKISESAVGKTVTGIISYVDNKYVAVVFNKDAQTGEEYEIGFWLDENVKFGRGRDVSSFHEGDTIEILYDEIQQEIDEIKEDGRVERKTRVDNFKPKEIKLRSPAKSKLRSN